MSPEMRDTLSMCIDRKIDLSRNIEINQVVKHARIKHWCNDALRDLDRSQFALGIGLYAEGDYNLAMEAFQAPADRGDPSAQYFMNESLRLDDETNRNHKAELISLIDGIKNNSISTCILAGCLSLIINIQNDMTPDQY